jgi:hypothetical protein
VPTIGMMMNDDDDAETSAKVLCHLIIFSHSILQIRGLKIFSVGFSRFEFCCLWCGLIDGAGNLVSSFNYFTHQLSLSLSLFLSLLMLVISRAIEPLLL